MKRIILIVILCGSALAAGAQSLAYRASFNFLFDNLEGSDPYADTRTLLALSLAPEVGINWDENHSLMVGASMIQDIGDSTSLTKTNLIAYYKYRGDRFSLLAGSFPRSYSQGSYPKSFFSESSNFYQPTIGGVMMQYNTNKGGYMELYGNWYGANQELRIDEFMIVGATEFPVAKNSLFVGGNVLLNHFKNDYFLEDSYLLERLLYNLYVGVNLQKFMPYMQVASASVGLLGEMGRKRILDTETSWSSYPGGSFDIAFQWKGIGLKNSLYFGDGQMPYYGQYGGDKFYWGSPFYQAEIYNRSDIYYSWQRRFVAVKANMAFNATDAGLASQQLLTVSVNISQILKGGHLQDYDCVTSKLW